MTRGQVLSLTALILAAHAVLIFLMLSRVCQAHPG